MHPFLGWVGIAESSLCECLSPDPCHPPPRLVDGIVSNLPQRPPLSYYHSPSTPRRLRMVGGDVGELFEHPLILSTAQEQHPLPSSGWLELSHLQGSSSAMCWSRLARLPCSRGYFSLWKVPVSQTLQWACCNALR